MVAILQVSSTGAASFELIASDHVPTAVANGDPVNMFVDINGRQITAQKVEIGTQTSVTGAAVDTLLLPANTARLGATIHNDSNATLYILLANTTASSSVFTVSLLEGGYYEIPYGYTGIIKGIWSTASGFARITELT